MKTYLEEFGPYALSNCSLNAFRSLASGEDAEESLYARRMKGALRRRQWPYRQGFAAITSIIY